MLIEYSCTICTKGLREGVQFSEEKLVNSEEENYCELCSEEISKSYFSIEKVELTEEIKTDLKSRILACGTHLCGRTWDSEESDYTSDETNSTLIELFDEIIESLALSNFQNLLLKLRELERLDQIDNPDLCCPNCDGGIDSWHSEIKIKKTTPLIPPSPEDIKKIPPAVSRIPAYKPYQKIEFYRSDCSLYLIHLVRSNWVESHYDNIDYETQQSRLEAPQILWLILQSHTLKKNKGSLIKEAVCFTEKPLTALKETLLGQESKERNNKALVWEPYGVMFKKDYLREQGVEPVIPLKKGDEEKLSEDLRYRSTILSNSINWVHEREWRSRGNINFDPKECIVLVPDFEQVTLFQQALNNEGIKVKGILPLLDLFATL